MRKWKVIMTFEGEVDAPTVGEATTAFKRELGIAPESMREMARVTDFHVILVADPDEPKGERREDDAMCGPS